MYISPNNLRNSVAKDVEGPALLISERAGENMFITGGTSSHLIFLEGEYRGRGFDCSDNSSWDGLVIENLMIEVDLDSAGSYSKDEMPLLSLAIENEALAIKVLIETQHGFREPRFILVPSKVKSGSGSTRCFFTRWRAILRDGNEIRTILEIDTSPEK